MTSQFLKKVLFYLSNSVTLYLNDDTLLFFCCVKVALFLNVTEWIE